MTDPVDKAEPDGRPTAASHLVTTRRGEVCHLKLREPTRRKTPPAFTYADVQTLTIRGLVAAGASIATLRRACKSMPVRGKDRARQKFSDGLRRFFDAMTPDEADAILAEYERAKARQLAGYFLDGRADWRPRMSLEGEDLIHDAVARGRGVILWGDNFLPRVFVGKRILSERGIWAAQVSVPTHGFPESRFASRFVHPLQVAAETRHCSERIVFDPGAKHGVKDRIEERLAQGKIVKLTNNVFSGRRFVDIPLNDGVTFEIARGPIDLALKTGAALLPYVAFEMEELSEFRGVIGENLIRDDRSHSDHPVCDAAMAYRDWLAPFLRSHPSQWVNWARVLDGVTRPPETAGVDQSRP